MKKISFTSLLILFFIISATVLLMLEIGVRIFIPSVGWRQIADSYLGWSTVEYQNFQPGKVNPPERKMRIVVFGDSYLAGSGIARKSERLSDRLQKLLKGRAAVKTLAAGGWGTDQELLAFIEKGKPWKPRLAVIAFCPQNDPMNIVSNSMGPGHYKPYFSVSESGGLLLHNYQGDEIEILRSPRSDRSVGVASYLFDLYRYLTLVKGTELLTSFPKVDPFYYRNQYWKTRGTNILSGKSLDFSPQDGISDLSPYLTQDFKSNTRMWQLMEAILRQFKQEGAETGTEVMLMMLPAPLTFGVKDSSYIIGSDRSFAVKTPSGTISVSLSEPGGRMKKICERTGVSFFDPSKDFIEKINRENRFKECYPFKKNEGHFSAAAQAILAEMLEKRLEEDFPELKK